jgi:hypothetical protein
MAGEVIDASAAFPLGLVFRVPRRVPASDLLEPPQASRISSRMISAPQSHNSKPTTSGSGAPHEPQSSPLMRYTPANSLKVLRGAATACLTIDARIRTMFVCVT